MTTGQKIKMLRERDGISQVELAERIGESKQTVYKYENDLIDEIPKKKIEAIAQIFDEPPEWLIGWKEKQPSYSIDEFLTKVLTEEEKYLLDGFRCASPELRQSMLATADIAIQGKKSSNSQHREEVS